MRDDRWLRAVLRDSEQIPAFLSFITGRDLVIQAGGNIGVYPLALAKHFARVLTFEPSKMNFDRLLEGVEGIANVEAVNSALGDRTKRHGLERQHPTNDGMLAITRGRGVRMTSLDELAIPSCDLIWLDVEGYETRVLRGAAKLIERCSPAIIVEGKGSMRWLREHGYNQVFHYRSDRLWLR